LSPSVHAIFLWDNRAQVKSPVIWPVGLDLAEEALLKIEPESAVRWDVSGAGHRIDPGMTGATTASRIFRDVGVSYSVGNRDRKKAHPTGVDTGLSARGGAAGSGRDAAVKRVADAPRLDRRSVSDSAGTGKNSLRSIIPQDVTRMFQELAA
jgi:hypothetical protein